MNNLKKIAFLFFVGSIIFIQACKDEKCGGPQDIYIYKFRIPVSIVPAQETYLVGDTITMSVNIPKNIVDDNHDLIENINSQNIFHSSWVLDVRGDFTSIDATTFIKVLLNENSIGALEIEEFSNNSIVVGVLGEPISDEFVASLQYRFVLKQAGIFWFKFSGQRTVNEEDGPLLSIANMCPNGSIHYKYEVNGGADNNFAVLCQTDDVFCTPVYADDNRGVVFDDRAGYIFKVTE